MALLKMEKTVAIDPADEYDRDAEVFMAHFAKFVTEGFGERCKDFDADCPCCKMWKHYDGVKDIAVFTEPEPVK